MRAVLAECETTTVALVQRCREEAQREKRLALDQARERYAKEYRIAFHLPRILVV